jgi:hypothetical protein
LLCRLLDWHPSVLSFPRELPLLSLFFGDEGKGDVIQYFSKSGGFTTDTSGKQAMFFHAASQIREREKLSKKLGLEIPVWPDTEQFSEAFLRNLETRSKTLLVSVMNALGHATIESVPGAKDAYQVPPVYFSLKTPLETERYAGRIIESMPNARFIHIIRDPVARYVSEKVMAARLGASPGKDNSMLDKSVDDWNESVDRARKNVLEIGVDKYRIVVYEDLVSRPAEIMRDVADFLGIPYSHHLVTPTYFGVPIKANSSFDNKSYGIDGTYANRSDTHGKAVSFREQIGLIRRLSLYPGSVDFYVTSCRDQSIRKVRRTMFLLARAHTAVSRAFRAVSGDGIGRIPN